jgi:hypothetical protein
VGLESVRGPHFSSGTLAFDTLDRLQARYPAHCGLPDFRLYPPSDCLCAHNLVAYIFYGYTKVTAGLYDGT